MAEVSVIEGLSKASLNRLVGDLMKITGIDNPKELIRSIHAHEWTLSHVITITSEFLAFKGKADVEVGKSVEPKKFFSGNPEVVIDAKLLGLFTTDMSFRDTTVHISKYVLKKHSLDSDILEDLPEDSTFDIDTFWQTIIVLIKNQPINTSGPLEDVVSNVFYLWDTSLGKRYGIQVIRPTRTDKWKINLYGIRETSGWGEGDVIVTPT